MRTHLLLIAALSACESSTPLAPDASVDAPPDTPPPFTPATCTGTPLTIHASPGGSPVSFGPVTLDQAGTTICLSLDAQQSYAYTFFEAQTALEPGTTSSFELSILSTTDVLLKQGADTTYGTPPQTVAYVGLSVEPRTVLPIKLVGRAKAAPTESWIRLYLIEPLD